MKHKVPESDLREGFDRYLGSMAEEIEALTDAVAASKPDSPRLDQSYASLDLLEDFLVACERESHADEALYTRVGRYLGLTLVRNAGGKWDYNRSNSEFPGQPVVTGLPLLRRCRLMVMTPVAGFRRHHVPGTLRDGTEPYDLPHRRRQMASRVEHIAEAIEELRRELVETFGVSPGAMSFDLDSVDALESSLLAALSQGASRDQRRRLRSSTALYLGAVLQRLSGWGEWQLCEEPKRVDFGELTMHDWAPFTLVKNVNPKFDRRLLRLNLEKVIRRVALHPEAGR